MDEHVNEAAGNLSQVSQPKQRRERISLKKKYEILALLRSGKSQTRVATELKFCRQTICQIWKQRDLYTQRFQNLNFSLKKCRRKVFERVDSALLQWFNTQRDQGMPISGPLLLGKAKQFADSFSLPNFKGSSGWLDKWKKRHSITFRRVTGEPAVESTETVADWFSEKWKSISKEYSPKDIYNCDETGLFWRMLPDQTNAWKNAKCSDGKMSQERITVLLCCNMDGSEKVELLVVGKSENPGAFKQLSSRDSLFVNYRANDKAWMTTKLFEDWLTELDGQMETENRNILLILDNCPSHSHGVRLKNVRLLFLPPNMNSACQPLDQGIIQNFKENYRGRLLRNVICNIEEGESGKVGILDSLLLLVRSWEDVTQACVANSFCHAGFLHDLNASRRPQTEHPGENLLLIPAYCAVTGSNYSASLMEYPRIDDELVTSEVPSDAEIVQIVMTTDSVEPANDCDAELVKDIESPTVSTKEYLNCLSKVKEWLLEHSSNKMVDLNHVLALEHVAFHHISSMKKQAQM